jgi:hypothetical protein
MWLSDIEHSSLEYSYFRWPDYRYKTHESARDVTLYINRYVSDWQA